MLYRNLFKQLGATFGTSFFHLSNFEEILGSTVRYVHGIRYPESRSMQG